jgi:hypothetical protein
LIRCFSSLESFLYAAESLNLPSTVEAFGMICSSANQYP